METEPNLDHQMSEETLILEGLAIAVRAGRITEDEKHEWLNEYIHRRQEIQQAKENALKTA